jgi:predicted nucleic acid-binding protein
LIFWDASAVVPLLAPDQPRAAELAAVLEVDGSVVVWWATGVECESAIVRAQRAGRMSDERVTSARAQLAMFAESWDEVPPSDSIRETAVRLLRRHQLSGADALQLAGALAWCGDRPAGQRFCCLDQRLSTAALAEGFDVLPAGARRSET